MHEFKHIVQQALLNQKHGLRSVLATVVYLEGSSYRKPGVRMLISETGQMIGAVSGGCVENEIIRRAQVVFADGKARVIAYDGRYRLGCEGILNILIEPFQVSEGFIQAFQKVLETRQKFKIDTVFEANDNVTGEFGSKVVFDDEAVYTFSETFKPKLSVSFQVLCSEILPSIKLIIIGAEHDAVKLCSLASMLGWEVDVLTSVTDPKQFTDFPGAKSVSVTTAENSDFKTDQGTAVVLMTHNYAQDLKYLRKLADLHLKYLAILGPSKRTDRLKNDLLDYLPELEDSFLEEIYSPAGLDIGSITPEEIALSILAEILSVFRGKKILTSTQTESNIFSSK